MSKKLTAVVPNGHVKFTKSGHVGNQIKKEHRETSAKETLPIAIKQAVKGDGREDGAGAKRPACQLPDTKRK